MTADDDLIEQIRRYRVRGMMAPLSGQPVNWNARAVVWRGCDRRYWLRQGIRRVVVVIRDRKRSKYPPTRANSLRYRLAWWLTKVVDDRRLGRAHFTSVQWWLRGVVNTQSDVEARKAWARAIVREALRSTAVSDALYAATPEGDVPST